MLWVLIPMNTGFEHVFVSTQSNGESFRWVERSPHNSYQPTKLIHQNMYEDEILPYC